METLNRILIGDVPASFLLEVLLRCLLLYFFLLAIVKALGKRMSGQLTITEMAIMLTLGAMVSAPMQVPERGIIQGYIVLTVVLLLYWAINRVSVKNISFEQIVNGRSSILVKDGVMQLDTMKANRISRQQLFAVLRYEQI